MPSNTVRRLQNRKFTEAAAAMGAFWERARALEALRIEHLRRELLERAEAAVGNLAKRPAIDARWSSDSTT